MAPLSTHRLSTLFRLIWVIPMAPRWWFDYSLAMTRFNTRGGAVVRATDRHVPALQPAPGMPPAGASSPRKWRRLARQSARPWNDTSGPIAASPSYQISVLSSGVSCAP